MLLDREPFAAASAEVLSLSEAGVIEGCLCATTITTIHYLAGKTIGAKQALFTIRKLLATFEIAAVNRPVLATALESEFTDFEDAVLYESARQVFAEAIVTRNPAGFKKAKLPTYTPEELCKALGLRTPESE